MEETLSNSRFITFHRQQINPEDDPQSTLTFAYGTSKYSKYSKKEKACSISSHVTFIPQIKSSTR